MLSEDIDDLFRDKLDGHATPPGDDLWARLQAQPGPDAAPATPTPPAFPAERLDRLFQQGLNAHATPLRRELWERLEDEHLRPRKRRAAGWWPLTMAAAVAALVVAGGASLWTGLPHRSVPAGPVAIQQPLAPSATGGAAARPAIVATIKTAKAAAALAANTPPKASSSPNDNVLLAANKKKPATQATRFATLASTAPKASIATARSLSRRLNGTTRTLDAAPGQSLQAANIGHVRPAAADEQRQTTGPAPVLVASQPQPAAATNLPTLAAGELITVEVRNGGEPALRPAKLVSSALAAVEPDDDQPRRRLGGRLLQQAGHLVRGERMSLAEVANLPENITLNATIAGHRVSKSIQL